MSETTPAPDQGDVWVVYSSGIDVSETDASGDRIRLTLISISKHQAQELSYLLHQRERTRNTVRMLESVGVHPNDARFIIYTRARRDFKIYEKKIADLIKGREQSEVFVPYKPPYDKPFPLVGDILNTLI